MAWKEMTVQEIAKSLGVSIGEVKAKQELIGLIIKLRKAQKLSQQGLARKVGVTQGRIAQIESGIGTSQISFEVLFDILTTLGYHYRIILKKAA